MLDGEAITMLEITKYLLNQRDSIKIDFTMSSPRGTFMTVLNERLTSKDYQGEEDLEVIAELTRLEDETNGMAAAKQPRID